MQKIERLAIVACLVMLPLQDLFSQHSTMDNYTGTWENPLSWQPQWLAPSRDSLKVDITIFGYIKTSGSLSFANDTTNFIIADTLVIAGDLYLGNKNKLTISDKGIIIIWGNLHISNKTVINANGVLVITGNIFKGGSQIQGAFTSNDSRSRVFIGGSVPSNLTNNSLYPVLDMVPPFAYGMLPHLNSGGCFGNMKDIELDQVLYAFFLSTCIPPVVNLPPVVKVCAGSDMKLVSAGGVGYTWTGPGGFTSNQQNPVISNAILPAAGIYSVTVTDAIGCKAMASTEVVIYNQPTAYAGPDQVLQYTFETTMSADLPDWAGGEWRVVSGSGSFADINSPASAVSSLQIGEHIFSWKVWNISEATCSDSMQVKLIVKDLFIPSVFTPNGDGQNDLFRFNAIRDGVRLSVFNKWGVMEYENSNYGNNWDGTDRNGKPLLEDTYFYILYFDKPRKGTVLIVR